MKNILSIACLLSLTTQQALPMAGIGKSSSSSFSTGSTAIAELTAAAEKVKYAQKKLIDDVMTLVNNLMNYGKSNFEESLSIFEGEKGSSAGLTSKLEGILEKIRVSEGLNVASSTAAADYLDMVQTILAQHQNRITELFEQVYQPIAKSAIITDASVKDSINQAIDDFSEKLSSIKKQFPARVRRSLKDMFKNTANEVGTAVGAGLIEAGGQAISNTFGTLIASLTGQKTPADLEAAKKDIQAAIDNADRQVEEIKVILNKGATKLRDTLNKVKRVNDDQITAVKDAYKIFTDPAYGSAPLTLKMDSLLKAIPAAAALVKSVDEKHILLINGVLEFATTVLGDDNDDKFIALKMTADKLIKSFTKIKRLLDESATLADELKVKMDSAPAPAATPTYPTSAPTTSYSMPSYPQTSTQYPYGSPAPTYPTSPVPSSAYPTAYPATNPYAQQPQQPQKYYNVFGAEVTNPAKGMILFDSPNSATRKQISF